MTVLVVVAAVGALVYGVVYGLAYGLVRGLMYGIVRARAIDWGRAVLVKLPRRSTPGTARRAGGQHRLEDAHTCSLSLAEIVWALNAEAGRRWPEAGSRTRPLR